MTFTPQQMIASFSELSGIRYPRPSHGMEQQAIDFCQSFSLADLSAVVGYVQKEIRAGRLDERSLGWRAFFGNYGSGNDFIAFQDRLAFALKTARFRPEPRHVPKTTDVGDGKITVFAPPEEIPPEPANEMIAQQFAEMQAARRKMMGGAA